MQMISVSSSDISRIGYENATLYIQFHSGGLYAYYNVPEQTYKYLVTASSCGKYFHSNIQKKFPYRRIS